MLQQKLAANPRGTKAVRTYQQRPLEFDGRQASHHHLQPQMASRLLHRLHQSHLKESLEIHLITCVDGTCDLPPPSPLRRPARGLAPANIDVSMIYLISLYRRLLYLLHQLL